MHVKVAFAPAIWLPPASLVWNRRPGQQYHRPAVHCTMLQLSSLRQEQADCTSRSSAELQHLLKLFAIIATGAQQRQDAAADGAAGGPRRHRQDCSRRVHGYRQRLPIRKGGHALQPAVRLLQL